VTDSASDENGRQGWHLAGFPDLIAMVMCLISVAASVVDFEAGAGIVRPALGTALLLAIRSLFLAWKTLAGTSLRPATIWGMLAVSFSAIAMFAGDVAVPGHPREGFFVHLSFLATLASLVSVLGARKPGENAWAILCGLFLAIGMLPMLEGIGLAKRFDVLDRLRSESPWTWFFVLVIIAGAGNYLPTRFGLPAFILGTGLAYHLRLIWTPTGRAEWRGGYWFMLPWALATAITLGAFLARRPRKFESPSNFQEYWIPFRDAWGAAWALRVLERVNQTCIRNGWPERLTWFGLMSAEPLVNSGDLRSEITTESIPNAVANQSDDPFLNSVSLSATLTVFLRRFGDPAAIRKL
jgi:hypothetical protein